MKTFCDGCCINKISRTQTANHVRIQITDFNDNLGVQIGGCKLLVLLAAFESHRATLVEQDIILPIFRALIEFKDSAELQINGLNALALLAGALENKLESSDDSLACGEGSLCCIYKQLCRGTKPPCQLEFNCSNKSKTNHLKELLKYCIHHP